MEIAFLHVLLRQSEETWAAQAGELLLLMMWNACLRQLFNLFWFSFYLKTDSVSFRLKELKRLMIFMSVIMIWKLRADVVIEFLLLNQFSVCFSSFCSLLMTSEDYSPFHLQESIPLLLANLLSLFQSKYHFVTFSPCLLFIEGSLDKFASLLGWNLFIPFFNVHLFCVRFSPHMDDLCVLRSRRENMNWSTSCLLGLQVEQRIVPWEVSKEWVGKHNSSIISSFLSCTSPVLPMGCRIRQVLLFLILYPLLFPQSLSFFSFSLWIFLRMNHLFPVPRLSPGVQENVPFGAVPKIQDISENSLVAQGQILPSYPSALSEPVEESVSSKYKDFIQDKFRSLPFLFFSFLIFQIISLITYCLTFSLNFINNRFFVPNHFF